MGSTTFLRRAAWLCAGVALVSALVSAQSPRPVLMAIGEVRPGMVGIGRTVFAGDTIEEFRVNVIGVLRNVIGPKRDLILAKLEGGPLATTGVIQGMSGSPVYIDGRLVGAVSYALGSFPREPIAGITPIAEMIEDIDRPGPRTAGALPVLTWPATSDQVFAALGQIATRALAPLRQTMSLRGDASVVGPAQLLDLAPSLRPIGAAFVVSGFDPGIERQMRAALTGSSTGGARPPLQNGPTPPLRPGDAVGMSLVRGDIETGATGTVTHVDGNRVYAFGHPFLNLGSAAFAMTRSRVYTVLPSLDSSMKIASLGEVIGVMHQDRATAVGGRLGPAPRELKVNVILASGGQADRAFTFSVVHDQMLTPLFAYVSVLNALAGYERNSGPLTVKVSSTTSFGADGRVSLDDEFSGDTALTSSAAAVTAPIAAAAINDFRLILPDTLDVRLAVSEEQRTTTIERVWLDTTRPLLGATHTVSILLRDFRGGTETVTLPVTMPAQVAGPVTLLVSDAPTLAALEQRELRPGKPGSWAALREQLAATRRNNRIYVRLITAGTGTVVGGETLATLPTGVRSVLDADSSVATAPVTRSVVGATEHPMNRVVRGSRELTLVLK